MTATEILLMIVAAAVTAAIAWWLLRSGPKRRDLSAVPLKMQPRTAAPGTRLPLELEREVRALVAERQMILAIKRLREETGLDLLQAKEAVERISTEAQP